MNRVFPGHLSENRLFIQVDRMRKRCGVFGGLLCLGASLETAQHFSDNAVYRSELSFAESTNAILCSSGSDETGLARN